jgi:hypothetical protein
MAEHDWYGPFAGVTRHGTVIVLTVGGSANLVAGLIGFDMFRKDVGAPRWFEPPLWDQVLLGTALLVAGAIGVRRVRSKRRTGAASDSGDQPKELSAV